MDDFLLSRSIVSAGDSPVGPMVSDAQSGGPARVDDGDYSTDSSADGRPQRRPDARRAHRGRQAVRLAAMREEADNNAKERTSVLPEIYRHSNKASTRAVLMNSLDLYIADHVRGGIEDVTTVNLEDLVKYSSFDLFSRAWPLVPLSIKNISCAPFAQIPEIPEIMNVRHPDTDQVAHFMRLVAIEIAKRQASPTSVFLRSLLVNAAVNMEAKKSKDVSLSVNSYPEDLPLPNWETDDRLDINEEDNMNLNSNIMQSTNSSVVDSLDWTIALSSQSLQPRIPLGVLTMLHGVLDRCGIHSLSSTLNSWGLQYLTRLLFIQMKSEALNIKETNSKICWLKSSTALMFKIVFATRRVDIFFTLLRWIHQQEDIVGNMTLVGLDSWITSIEACSRLRMRLPFSVSLAKASWIPLVFSVGLEFLRNLVGLCVIQKDDGPQGVLFSKQGIYKIDLKPPYGVLSENKGSHLSSCRGVFIEDNYIAVQDDYAKVVTFYDMETLQERRVREIERRAPNPSFQVYNGSGGLVTPHYFYDNRNPKYACFYPLASVNGMVEPSTLAIPTTTDSLSVQFYLFPRCTPHDTTMELIQIHVSLKIWLSIKLTVHSSSSTLSIIFEHGDGVLVEVHEPLQENWTLWSACMHCIRGVATWSVYRDGVLFEGRAVEGNVFKPSVSAASIKFVRGTFSGFISRFQLWCKSQPVMELLKSATGAFSGKDSSSSLLCFFKMNEGSGCCFQNSTNSHIWKGTAPSWRVPEKTLFTSNAVKSETIPYLPSEDYYVTSSEYETVIVENGFCTWIDMEGLILEQQFLNVNPSELYFFCSHTSRVYSLNSKENALQWVQTQFPTMGHIKELASVKNSENVSAKVFDSLGSQRLTPALLSEYLLQRVNWAILLNVGSGNRTNDIEYFFLWISGAPVSLTTFSRLVNICVELKDFIGPSATLESDFAYLLLCVCGRLLTRQLSKMGRRCPEKFGRIVIEMCEGVKELASNTHVKGFAYELETIFSHLHEIFLAECASHVYQFDRIMKAEKLIDVKELLISGYLSSLVNYMMEKEDRKFFMGFLGRLKDECLGESELILGGHCASFRASSATLTTLLGALSHSNSSQWHLTVIALMCSLCKGVLDNFERLRPSSGDSKRRTTEELDVLKQTSIGVVVFPIAHIVSDIEFERVDAQDVLLSLNEMREQLSSYAPQTDPQTVTHSFIEPHKITTSPASSYTKRLDLRYAQNIEVFFEHSRTGDVPHVTVTLLKNDYTRVAEPLNERIIFNSGGELEVHCVPSAQSKETVVTVNAHIELKTESTHWIHEICSALSHAIVRITRQLLLTDLSNAIIFPRESIFRGGLSHDALQKHRVHNTAEKFMLDRTEQVQLRQLCEESTAVAVTTNENNLLAEWKTLYTAKRIPYAERLEHVLRWFCAAHVWHSYRPRNVSLKEALSETLDVLRKKSFLLLEALQQGQEGAMLERARFLLLMVNPRSRIEALLAEHQQTEEPVTNISRPLGARVMSSVQSLTSVTSFSRDRTGSRSASLVKRVATSASDVSVVHQADVGSVVQPRTSLLDAGAVSESLCCIPESTSSQIMSFLLYGYGKYSNEQLTEAMVLKAQQASMHAAAYRLQENLCSAYQFDERMTSLIVCSHLLYRESTHVLYDDLKADMGTDAQTQNSTVSNKNSENLRDGLYTDPHYIELMVGCGVQRERELQRSFCSFIHSVLHNFLNRCSDQNKTDQEVVEVISLCAIFCHPWDSVDMSIIRPEEIFCVLGKSILLPIYSEKTTLPAALEFYSHDAEAWFMFLRERGLFNLLSRAVFIPNTLQSSSDRVSIVEGETLGIHAEDVDICFLARNQWCTLKSDTGSCQTNSESDYFADFASGCIMADAPEVLYFEMTLELVLNEKSQVSMGISSAQFPSTETKGDDNAIIFISDGLVKNKNSLNRFSCRWSVGDVIGCGVLAPFNSVFFTRNGAFLGIASNFASTTMRPYINIQAVSSLVKLVVNFGEQAPFTFDIVSLHSSSRTRLATPAMLGDSAFVTAHYLVILCFKNLSLNETSESMANQDSVCALLEAAAAFLCKTVLELVSRLKHLAADGGHSKKNFMTKSLQNGTVLLARLFRIVDVVIDCFRFDVVTKATHFTILQLCAVTLTDAHDMSIKVRAARCLGGLSRALGQDYLGDAVQSLPRHVSPDAVVDALTELARGKAFTEPGPSVFVPRWKGGLATVHGKGVFYGSAPMPARGTHRIGFRIRRRQQEGRGPGAPLGGCYYVGLAHGRPPIANMSSLIARSDVYVLQDTDDNDQVGHLLLRRHCIPRSSQRRIYGNDDIVWVEFNADVGEITYYRDNMTLIGLAFAYIQSRDDLYPMVFHFNDDASCELIQSPTPYEDPCELQLIALRRSIAVHTLQQLHVAPVFNVAVSQWVYRFLTRSSQDIDKCLVALAILGGEKSSEFCHHETHGAVVVDSLSTFASMAIVYLEADGDMRLFPTKLSNLKPSFVRPPLFALSDSEGFNCAALLISELSRILYEASTISPLIQSETQRRKQIEKEFDEWITDSICLEYIGLLGRYTLSQSVLGINTVGPDLSNYAIKASTSSSFLNISATGEQSTSGTPIVIDQRLSTPLFTPNPSIGITTGNSYSVIRGNLLLARNFSFAVCLTTTSKDSLLYVGFSSETKCVTDPREVALCRKTWAVCNIDSRETTSVNCSLEHTMIFSSEQELFKSGDVIIVQVKRDEQTASISRLRAGKLVDFGVLFESIPRNARIRPFVLVPTESVVIFSFLDGHTFPVRHTFSLKMRDLPNWESVTWPTHCVLCHVELSSICYQSEGDVCLCSDCFNSWQYPQMMFHVSSPQSPSLDYIVSRNSPKKLVVGDVVELAENSIFTWSKDQSVNVDIQDTVCMANSGHAFATLKSLTMLGNCRVDVSLTHVAGVNGFPFAGVLPFAPSWRVGNVLSKSSLVSCDSLLISSTTIVPNSKVFFGLHFTLAEVGQSLSTSGFFVGVTNLTSCGVANNVNLEQYIANHNIWGTWCDTKSKISSSQHVFVLVDMTRGFVAVSSSLLGLHLNPVVVTSNCPVDDEETNLKIAIFSRDRCTVTFTDGFISLNEMLANPSPSPIGIGILPEDAIGPEGSVKHKSYFLLDSNEGNITDPNWKVTPLVEEEKTGGLFFIGDTLTIYQENQRLFIYRNGLLIVTRPLSEEFVRKPHRLVIYLSTRGMIAKTVPPPYGRYHIAKVIQTCGFDLGIVECICPCQCGQRCVVRRKDVRYCALAVKPASAEIGASVVFKSETFSALKRGVVTFIDKNTANVRDTQNKSAWITEGVGSLYLMGNESSNVVPEGQYPPIEPPSSMVTRVFEVGKSKYRLLRNSSYNGIMFDCEVHKTILLTGLSVLTQASGRHRVDVYFKKGSHYTYERDSSVWTRIFSNLVGMSAGHQFNVTFSGIHIEANTTFALYINASHNCGVGHYTKEDGCTGSICTSMDGDGVLTALVGRTSESSTAFSESSATPRGFCGSLIYMQSNDTQQLVEDGASSLASFSSETAQILSEPKDNLFVLQCCPSVTRAVSSVEFIVEVFEISIVIKNLFLPVLIRSNDTGHLTGQAHVRFSIFYSVVDEVKGVENSERNWIWGHHEMLSLNTETSMMHIKEVYLPLKKGTYIICATCGDVAEEQPKGNSSNSLVELLQAGSDSFTMKNNFLSVRHFAGDIYASPIDDVIMSDNIWTLYTGRYLNQGNSASYNGIMFDIRSKRDILLEEVFCFAQTTADNVNVAVFWREGSIEGVEKDPSQWRHIVTKNMFLADKQYFSACPLNLQLWANRVYSLYINTSSSCGVRFYNSSDGHVGDVGDEFEDDGVLTIFVGKKSESPKAFLEIPTEPRGFRGRITYRTFVRTPPFTQNRAVFPAFQGFVVARILAALIAYVGASAANTALFADKNTIDELAKLVTSTSRVVCCSEAAENLLSGIMKMAVLEKLRSESVTIPFSKEKGIQFDSLCKGDLAVVGRGATSDVSTGQLVRLLENHDENYDVNVQIMSDGDETHLKISQENLLPVIECPDCHEAFAVKTNCAKTGKAHLPPRSEEERLVNIMTRHLTQHYASSVESSNTRVKAFLCNAASCNAHFFGGPAHTTPESQDLSVETLDSQTTLYNIPLDFLLKGRKGAIGTKCVFPFVHSAFMNASVSLSFTYALETWKIALMTDLPLRLSKSDTPRVFELRLQIKLADDTCRELTTNPATYLVVPGGPVLQEFLWNAASCLHFSCLQNTNGMVCFRMHVKEGRLPSPTPPMHESSMNWLWSNGSNVIDVQPGETCDISEKFTFSSWPKDTPRFCQMKVTSPANDLVFFVEVKVFLSFFSFKKVWRPLYRSLQSTHELSFSRDEELTLAFTEDKKLVIHGEENIPRCCIPLGDLNCATFWGGTAQPVIAFENVGKHPLTMRLHHPSAVNFAARRIRESHDSFPWVGQMKYYSPVWASYDSRKIKLSADKLTASCTSDSGLAVIGSPLPMTGLSGFIIRMDRSDRKHGASLGSGHFAGIAVSTFDRFSLNLKVLREDIHSLWAIQDIDDADSFTTQESIPHIKTSRRDQEMFSAGTKLRFIVDRDNGILSLARGDEMPRVIFRNIPHNVSLSPFVRLDHENTSATLAPLSCALWGNDSIFSLAPSVLSSQSLRPSILRQFPLTVVLSMYPIFSHFTRHIPLDRMTNIENIWSNRDIATREDYRLSVALQDLVELGAFSRNREIPNGRKMKHFCSREEVQRVLSKLSKPLEHTYVVLSEEHDDKFNAVLSLSCGYELIRKVGSKPMYQLLYFDQDGIFERTLHVFQANDRSLLVHTNNAVKKHPCVMHQVEILPSLSLEFSSFGVITDGWYDTTLSCMEKTTKKQQHVIAKSLIEALEHWHLYGLPHGHIMPENIYIRIDHESPDKDIIACSLWNVHVLDRHHYCASAQFRRYGLRCMKEDVWSCAHVLRSFQDLTKADTKLNKVLDCMCTEFPLPHGIREAVALKKKLSGNSFHGTEFCFQTGTHRNSDSASQYGIMFDVLAKGRKVFVRKVTFVPNTTLVSLVTLFVHEGSFTGVETTSSAWRVLAEQEMRLVDGETADISDFELIEIPAGGRVALCIHTTSNRGVLAFSKGTGNREYIGAVEEENHDIGVTVGKKCEGSLPFVGVQNKKYVFKGSITYTVPLLADEFCRRVLVSAESDSLGEQSVYRPVMYKEQPGLVLEESEDECLLYKGDSQCQWVSHKLLQNGNFEECAGLEVLEYALRGKFCKERYQNSAFSRCTRPVCSRKLQFSLCESPDGRTWLTSDPISCTCMVAISVQGSKQLKDSLFIVPTTNGTTIDYEHMEALPNNGMCAIYVDAWRRSVFSSGSAQKVIKKLYGDISQDPLRLILGTSGLDMSNITVTGVISMKSDHLTVSKVNDTTHLVEFTPPKHLGEDCLLNGITLRCHAHLPAQIQKLEGTSVSSWHRDIFFTLLRAAAREPIRFLVDVQPRRRWTEEVITFETFSNALEINHRRVRQIARGGPFVCAVTRPVFSGAKVHEVEFLVACPANDPLRVCLKQPSTNWSLDLTLPFFRAADGAHDFSSCGIQSMRVFVRVIPAFKRMFVSADGGVVFDTDTVVDFPSEFHLEFLLFARESFVEMRSWRVYDGDETVLSRESMEAMWNQIQPSCISPMVPNTVGALTAHSEFSLTAPLPRDGDTSVVSKIEEVIVAYARQLLGTVILNSKSSLIYKKLQYLLPFTSLRNDMSALSAFVFGEAKKSSFHLIATSCAYLSSPTIVQTMEMVEVSINIVWVALLNGELLPLLSSAFGPTLMLQLLHTATVYTRSIRHTAIRCVLKLLNTPSCWLPSHEVLSAAFAPLLGMMNGLCRKGKILSIVVQLGISLICALIKRYRLERPHLIPLGEKSAVPYTIVTCVKVAIDAITANPPLPLPLALTQDVKDMHTIQYEVYIGHKNAQGVTPCHAKFVESFRCTSGMKTFEVVLASKRSGSVVVGWDMDAVIHGSLFDEPLTLSEGQCRTLLPSCGYYVDASGKIFVLLCRKRESQPLKMRARGGDVLAVKSLYNEQVVVIQLRRGTRVESTTRFETYPNELLALPVFFAENSEDATFDGSMLAEKSPGLNVAQLYCNVLEHPDQRDTTSAPQSYEFYAELALFCQNVLNPQQRSKLFASSAEKDTLMCPSHDLVGFPLLSAYLGAGVPSSGVQLSALAPYVKCLKVFDALTSMFSVVVDLRRRTELFELWKKVKNLCSMESAEKIQKGIMRPFRNRVGQQAHVIIHTMQARPSERLGPHPTLMRSIFGQLFAQLQKRPVAIFYASPMCTVKLAGFGSTDAGGPYRDVLSHLAAEIMTTHPRGTFQLNPLFVQCGRGGQSAVMPDVAATLQSHLPYMFHFFGRLLALCFSTKDLLAVDFPPLFWKLLLSEAVEARDLLAIDPDVLRQLAPEELADRTAEELEERFPGLAERWRRHRAGEGAAEEKPQEEFPPTEAQALRGLAEEIIVYELKKYDSVMGYIQRGFDEVVPLYTLSAFRWQQVELAICGAPRLSFEALRDACDIHLPSNDANMFLNVLTNMSDEDRMLLLRFTTGQTRLPLREAIKVRSNGTLDSLPTSSTCFFTFRLPPYSSQEAMREKILYAIRQCEAIDTDGLAREHIILDN